VRMYNAKQNVLALWQHLEFAVWAKVFSQPRTVWEARLWGGTGNVCGLPLSVASAASLGKLLRSPRTWI
jgi:hypothetical protein